ncbi:MAG TPA: HD domain-containing phosphohydrolase, partial [Anaerolineales bacterium]
MMSDVGLFEQEQKRRILTTVAWTVLLTSVALGLYDIQFNTWISVIALFALALLCIPILIFSRTGHLSAAAILLSLTVLLVIALNLYDGDGVRDAGILALPIFIMTGTLLLGRRAAPFFAAAAVFALALVAFLESSGYVHPTFGPAGLGLIAPMVVLLLAASAFTWVIVNTMEKNLQRAKDSEGELRLSYDLTLAAWAKILEYRDMETRGHTERVAALAEQLARLMGMRGQALVDLRRGALLHDIGKLAIRDSILLKPGELTEAEWTQMKQHPTLAHEVLAPIPYLQHAMDVPWCHHERWDGTGYPRGLRGEEI